MILFKLSSLGHTHTSCSGQIDVTLKYECDTNGVSFCVCLILLNIMSVVSISPLCVVHFSSQLNAVFTPLWPALSLWLSASVLSTTKQEAEP